jgi:hypothetical protein
MLHVFQDKLTQVFWKKTMRLIEVLEWAGHSLLAHHKKIRLLRSLGSLFV